MVTKFKGVTIVLGGLSLVVPPMSLGALEQMQDRLTSFAGEFDKASVSTAIDSLHLCLKRNYPEMSREEVADLIDVGNTNDIMLAVMDANGYRRKSQEAEQSGNPQPPLTGGTSMPASLPLPDILLT